MSRTLNTDEISPGDTVEVWEGDQLECRGVAEEWSAPDPGDQYAPAAGLWRVRDEITGSVYDIPESYLVKVGEDF
jgi:hypothetical protein